MASAAPIPGDGAADGHRVYRRETSAVPKADEENAADPDQAGWGWRRRRVRRLPQGGNRAAEAVRAIVLGPYDPSASVDAPRRASANVKHDAVLPEKGVSGRCARCLA